MSVATPTLDAILRPDPQIVIIGLVAISLSLWFYILARAGMEMGNMPAISGGAMMAMAPA